MFPIKSKNVMLQEMMIDLEEKTGINDFSPGSIARSLLEVFNEKLYGTYSDFEEYMSNAYLGSAEGEFIDKIGEIFDCARNGDTDENYKYRISKQVYLAAKSNETAVRLNCLSVPEVKDIIIRKYTKGSGSFTVYVITDEIKTPDKVLEEVRQVVESTKAEGINAEVRAPKPVPIDIVFSVKLAKNIKDEGKSVEIQSKIDIQDHVDLMPMGSSISIQKITSIVALNTNVKNAFLSEFKVDGEDVIIKDEYQLEWDERPYINNLTINII